MALLILIKVRKGKNLIFARKNKQINKKLATTYSL